MSGVFRLAFEAVQNLPAAETGKQFTGAKAVSGWLLAGLGDVNDNNQHSSRL